MRKSLDTIHLGDVCETLRETIGRVYFDQEERKRKVKTVTKFITPRLMVRATWHASPHLKNSLETMVVSYGDPNFRERRLLKHSLKGKPYPHWKYYYYPLKK